MALRFMDGFDHYTTTASYGYKYSTYTVSAAPSTGRRSGSAAARLGNYGGDYIQKVMDDQTTWIVGFAYKREAAGNSELPLVQLKDSTGSVQSGLYMHCSDGLLRLWRGDMSTLLATSSSAIPLNTWCYIELKTFINDTTGTLELRVNGTTVATYTGDTKQSSSLNTARTIRLAGGVYSSSYYGFIDDLYVCDGAGTTNNDFLGDCRVDTLYPNGVGNSAQFTPTGSSANWENVKDTTIDEDTTNNASATSGQIDSFAFGDLSNLGSSVFGVQNNLVAKKDDAGTRTMRSVTRIGGTNYESADYSLGTTYLDYVQLQEQNPATAVAWTVDAINGAEFGYKVQA
ncbi:MAG: hypothetical protein IPI58_00745 [Alphaproteobacteria bacterium]|nr:MAG: hypothetical protein IPI58_00745 [Alphaproteobacteria bacterium]